VNDRINEGKKALGMIVPQTMGFLKSAQVQNLSKKRAPTL
jgi:hypothetical protein